MNRASFSHANLRNWFIETTGWSEAVVPDYAGGSIANLPASILAELAPFPGDAPAVLDTLRPDILPPRLLADARVIVLLVVDGMGQENLQDARRAGLIEWLDSARHASTMTSVFPSTTVAALTSLQTALPPAVHGMAGYTVYLAPQQATVNMIGWKAAGGMKLATPLPDPKGFLGVPNIYQRLNASDIDTVIVSNKEFADSPLTNIQSAGVPYAGHRTMAEMAGLLEQEVSRPGRRFVFGYWDGFDTLSHTHGPAGDIAMNELYLLDQAVGRGLLRPLAERARGDVVVLVGADHGHASLHPERLLSLGPVLNGRTGDRPIPTGDRRATGLPFSDAERLSHVRDIAGDNGVIIDVEDAIQRGLYGPGPGHPDLRSRIGETLLLSTRDGAFVYPQSSNPTAGGHGSMTRQEMLVPLLYWRF